MMTPMTTVLNRDLENDWPNFPLSTEQVACIQVFFGLHGVAASSFFGLDDRVLDSVATPLFKSGYVFLIFQRHSVKFFHIGLRVSLFVHAHLMLLITEFALQDGSAIALLRGIQVIFCSFEFLRLCRFSIPTTPLGIYQY